MTEPKPQMHDYLVSKYSVKQELATGRSGKVDLAVSKRGSPVVVKKMVKRDIEADWVKNEVRAGQIMRDTKGIVKFREHFEDEQHDYVIVDYVKGDDLFVFMQKRDFRPLKERQARTIIKQLVKSLLSCHKNGISHKDINWKTFAYREDSKRP